MRLKDKIKFILECYHLTRNDDKLLFIQFLRYYYPDKLSLDKSAIMLDELLHLPKTDTIFRIRRKIQNEEGLFLPTEKEIALKRGISERIWNEVEEKRKKIN